MIYASVVSVTQRVANISFSNGYISVFWNFLLQKLSYRSNITRLLQDQYHQKCCELVKNKDPDE